MNTGGGAVGAVGAVGAGGAALADGLPSTGKTVLHTLQRARTPPAGTLAGSTRYTVSHDGQVTFMCCSLGVGRVGLDVVAPVDHEVLA